MVSSELCRLDELWLPAILERGFDREWFWHLERPPKNETQLADYIAGCSAAQTYNLLTFRNLLLDPLSIINVVLRLLRSDTLHIDVILVTET